jgi:hypothetical protein
MKYWIGKWIIAVSIIHTIFAFVVFSEVILQILLDGVFNSVGADSLRGAVVWFLLFGFVLFAFGLATNIIEEMSNGDVPVSIGFSLLFVILLGVILMPISGFWLALPPALTIIYKRYKNHWLIDTPHDYTKLRYAGFAKSGDSWFRESTCPKPVT